MQQAISGLKQYPNIIYMFSFHRFVLVSFTLFSQYVVTHTHARSKNILSTRGTEQQEVKDHFI